jgi:WD40 repeat protein
MTGSDDKKIIVWDVKNRKILKVLHRNKKIVNLVAS